MLLSLDQSDLKLSILLFFFHGHELSQDVFEELKKTNAWGSFLCNFIEHVFEPDHVEGTFLERKLHDLEHDDNELLDVDLFIGYFFELLLYLGKLLVKHQPADRYRRVLR